jgi:hypothetical protein
MCGGGTTPILGRSGVPAISRPPLGGGVGSVLENGEGGGGYFLEKFAHSNFLNLKSITQSARFISEL